MMEGKPIILSLLLLMFIYTEVQAASYTTCKESASTVRPLDRCPTDSKSWEMAAKKMNCDAIKQNCSQPSRRHLFQYHCVINAWMNETLEVCAPNRTIFDQSCYQLVKKKNRQIIEYSNEDIKKPVVHVKSTSEGLRGDTCIAVIFLPILLKCVL